MWGGRCSIPPARRKAGGYQPNLRRRPREPGRYGLPIIDRYKIKATFFVLPDNVEERLDGWKRAVKTGGRIEKHVADNRK
jgi:peptidoglycan/xylan/chitin deacetylase (PgdA/CDA1 family)